LDRMIFVAIAIAALGAVGVTMSIMSIGIPAYAQQTYTTHGKSTLSFPAPGEDIQTFSGSVNNQLGPTPIHGGGVCKAIDGNVVSVQGSPGFKASPPCG
jgi:hypothetical protein